MITLLICRSGIRISFEYVPQFTIEVRQVALQPSQLILEIAKRSLVRDQSEWLSIDIDHRGKLEDDNQKECSIIWIQLARYFAKRKVIQHRAYLFAAYRNNSIPLIFCSGSVCSLRNLHGTEQRGRGMHRLRESNDRDKFCLCLYPLASLFRCSDLSLNRSPGDHRRYKRYTRHYDVAGKPKPIGGPNVVFEDVGHRRRQKCSKNGRKRNNPDRREARKVVSIHGVYLPRVSIRVEGLAA
jgi:hypothetical protein